MLENAMPTKDSARIKGSGKGFRRLRLGRRAPNELPKRAINIIFVAGNRNRKAARQEIRFLQAERPDWRFVLAVSPGELERLIKEEAPSAAVIDLDYTECNILDLILELRMNASRLPVIILSSSPTDKFLDEARNCGGFAVVEKPFAALDLIGAMERGFFSLA